MDLEKLLNKIIVNNIDMHSILVNPTEENLSRALSILELPKKALIKSAYLSVNKQIELPITQFFKITAIEAPKDTESSKSDQCFFGYLTRNTSGYRINNLLEQFLTDTGQTIQNTINTLTQLNNIADDFPENSVAEEPRNEICL